MEHPMPRKSKTRKQPALRKPPRLVDSPEQARDRLVLNARDALSAEAHASLYGKGFVNSPRAKLGELTVKQLMAGGRAAYDAWVLEAGYAKDARIKPYDKLKAYSHPRWERIARDVYNAMRAAI
jgi:hypothetical protein